MTGGTRPDDEAAAFARALMARRTAAWPYPPPSDREMQAVVDMMLFLWRGIMRTGSYAERWEKLDEPHYTAAMHDNLLDMRKDGLKPVPAYFALFRDEHMDRKERSASKAGDGDEDSQPFKGKEPDWTLFPRRSPRGVRARHAAVFVESKMIKEKSLTKYGMTGIRAFTSLSYARAMSRAMLMGYVVPTRKTSPKDLLDYLANAATRKTLEVVKVEHLESGDYPAWFLFESQHGRPEAYEEFPDRRPGDIRLRHLWLTVYSV